MPTYDYQCKVCKTIDEYTHKMDIKINPHCMRCAEFGKLGVMNKVFSPCRGLHFKGTGFYKTDYK